MSGKTGSKKKTVGKRKPMTEKEKRKAAKAKAKAREAASRKAKRRKARARAWARFRNSGTMHWLLTAIWCHHKQRG